MNTLTHRLREGLALIGITAVLAAILLPLARHYGSPEDDACLSNLQQIGQAHRLYEMDYDEMLVPYVLWGAESQRWTRLIASRLTDISVFGCPLDHLDEEALAGAIPYPTTYGCNWYLSSGAGTLSGTNYPARPYAFLKDPSATIRLADSAFILCTTADLPPSGWREDLSKAATGDIFYFYLPQNPLTGEGGTALPGCFFGSPLRPFPRHGGYVNVSFYDGHAAAVPGSQFDPKVTRYGNADCLWDNVAGAMPFTMSEAATAMRIAAGVQASVPADVTRLDGEGTSPGVDVLDAAGIARKAAGLEENP